MENYKFENLQIDHNYYLYQILEKPLPLILKMKDYKSYDIHSLLSIAEELKIEFGILPDWVLQFKEDHNKNEVERFLHCKLWDLSYTQRPSLGHKEYKILFDQFKVDRVYQFLRIDRQELAKVKYA